MKCEVSYVTSSAFVQQESGACIAALLESHLGCRVTNLGPGALFQSLSQLNVILYTYQFETSLQNRCFSQVSSKGTVFKIQYFRKP